MSAPVELAAELESAGEGQQADRIWRAGAAVFGEDFAGEQAQRFVWFAQKEAWLDAAMTLVPEGWNIQFERTGKASRACVWRAARNYSRYATTPALALCAAALRARGAEQ